MHRWSDVLLHADKLFDIHSSTHAFGSRASHSVCGMVRPLHAFAFSLSQPMPVLVPAFLFSPAVQVFASPCSNCSFVSSVADVINPFLPVSVSNSPLGAGSPSASRSASCCSPSASPGASSAERSRLSKCDPETEASRAATSSSVSTGTVSSRARRTASFSRSPTGTSGTVSLPLSPRPGREMERNGDCWGDRRTEKVEPRRSASSSPRQRDSGDSGTARRRSRVEARRPSLLGRKHREGRDRSEERRDRRRKTDSRESRVERRSSPREKTEGRRLKSEEKRDGRRSPSREKRDETRSVSREKREERRDQKGGSLSRLTRRRGAVNVSETVEAETHASGSAGRLCARYSRSPSQQTSERGKSVAETRKSRDWQGRESERCKGDDEEEALSGDGEEGLREESRDGGRRRRTEMHHSMKREDAAAASERIAQNRRIGHASCRGGPLNLRNASNPIGDEFGSWYRRLEETEEAERQAADLRYRLRRGEERMELLKKLSSRAEKSNKQVHTTKTPAVRRGRSAPEEAEPEKKTKACNSSRQISPHASTRTDPVFSSISSKEESFAKTADTRQPRRAACLFSASCRKREVNRFRQLHSVHVRGSQGEKVVQIDVASLDFLPPACWPVRQTPVGRRMQKEMLLPEKEAEEPEQLPNSQGCVSYFHASQLTNMQLTRACSCK
ncbi:hypothetical protein TGFOU_266035 [Toxoplasma gondii FOU]|uniref:Uncharacterized protein n=1 Tax=Toxoplasma gondii FOU TaxID=943167 RepID=A0A086KBW2_TOXGO|nr:hypothetical protein TGFOU_266035 [Toxoplasma gondii FOU]